MAARSSLLPSEASAIRLPPQASSTSISGGLTPLPGNVTFQEPSSSFAHASAKDLIARSRMMSMAGNRQQRQGPSGAGRSALANLRERARMLGRLPSMQAGSNVVVLGPLGPLAAAAAEAVRAAAASEAAEARMRAELPVSLPKCGEEFETAASRFASEDGSHLFAPQARLIPSLLVPMFAFQHSFQFMPSSSTQHHDTKATAFLAIARRSPMLRIHSEDTPEGGGSAMMESDAASESYAATSAAVAEAFNRLLTSTSLGLPPPLPRPSSLPRSPLSPDKHRHQRQPQQQPAEPVSTKSSRRRSSEGTSDLDLDQWEVEHWSLELQGAAVVGNSGGAEEGDAVSVTDAAGLEAGVGEKDRADPGGLQGVVVSMLEAMSEAAAVARRNKKDKETPVVFKGWQKAGPAARLSLPELVIPTRPSKLGAMQPLSARHRQPHKPAGPPAGHQTQHSFGKRLANPPRSLEPLEPSSSEAAASQQHHSVGGGRVAHTQVLEFEPGAKARRNKLPPIRPAKVRPSLVIISAAPASGAVVLGPTSYDKANVANSG